MNVACLIGMLRCFYIERYNWKFQIDQSLQNHEVLRQLNEHRMFGSIITTQLWDTQSNDSIGHTKKMTKLTKVIHS